MTEIVLATGNPHKLGEFRSILRAAAPDWEVEVSGVAPEVDETGATYEDNAVLKALAVARRVGAPTVLAAEDSGIEVAAMDGRPGVRSARWVTEDRWVPAVLEELEGLNGARRSARYVAALAAIVGDREPVVFHGVVEGRIAESPRGDGGFGYDPIFVPAEGDGRTFAEMTEADKHALSHRGRAIRRLVAFLRGTTSGHPWPSHSPAP